MGLSSIAHALRHRLTQAKLRRASLATIESLEGRALFSISGPATIVTGASYTLNLKPDLSATVSGISIDWGDGSTSSPSTTATTASHTYTTSASVTPTATFTYSGGATTTDALGLDVAYASNAGELVTPLISQDNIANGIAVQSNGKTIVSGRTSATGAFAIVRYNADGTLDTSFGSSGTVTTSFNYGATDVLALAVTGDEAAGTLKIYAAGFYGNSNLSGGYGTLGIARYNANGTLDTTFNPSGTTPGIVVTDLTNNQCAIGLAVQPSGKLLVGGAPVVSSGGTWTTGGYTIERYATGGTLDTSFASAGKLNTAYDSYFGNFANFNASGAIVTVGLTSGSFILHKYSTEGVLDSTFGTSGSVNTGFLTGNDQAYLVTVDSSNNILVGGANWNNSVGANTYRLKRYTSSGSADTTFGAAGTVVTTLPQGSDWTNNIVIDPDDRILVAGVSGSGSGKFDLMRFNYDGSLDDTFGAAGTLHSDFSGGNTSSAGAMAAGNGVNNALILQTVGTETYCLMACRVNDSGGTPRVSLVRFRTTPVLRAALAGPTLTAAASSSPTTITGKTSTVTMGATETGCSLNYMWTVDAGDPAAVDFAHNGTASASSTTATFKKAGTYSIRGTAVDPDGNTVTSVVSVTVTATATSLILTPQAPRLGIGDTWQFHAVLHDQFGDPMALPTDLTWSVAGPTGVDHGTINGSSGLYTAPATTGGPFVVTASSLSRNLSGTATVMVSDKAGPRADWRLDGSQSAAVDSSGFGNTGSLVNDPTWGGGRGNAPGLYLNGAGQYVSVPDAAALNPTAGLTVAAYINADDWNSNRRIVQKSTDGPDDQYALWNDNGAMEFSIAGVGVVSTTLPSTGEWHSIVGTYDGSVLSIYVDGALASSADATGDVPSTAGSLTIGDKPGSADDGESFKGSIAEVKVYGYAVDGGDVAGVFPAPTVDTAAASSDSVVTGSTATLSVLGASDAGEANLTYRWAVVSEPDGAPDPTFDSEGTNGAKLTNVTFYQAGSYVLQATISDGLLSTTSNVSVEVDSSLASLIASPESAQVANDGTYQLAAVALDQFGQVLSAQPSLTWSTANGSLGTISSDGVYSAASAGSGTDTATASADDGNGHTATVDVQVAVSSSASTPTSSPASVTDAMAVAEDGTDVQVVWTPGDATADGYMVEASTDGGSTYTPIGFASSGATKYLASNLVGGVTYTFRVTPYNAIGFGGSSVTTNTASGPALTSQASTEGWYKISFGDGTTTSANFQKGDAGATPGGSLQLTSVGAGAGGWIKATSAADAVRQALTGTFTSGATSTSFAFATSGALRYNPDFEFAGNDVGPAIVAEDRFDTAGHGDADYNDAYVPINVVKDDVWAAASTGRADIPSSYSLPTGAVIVGRLGDDSLATSASDYSATVTWANHATTTAAISAYSDFFLVSATPPAGQNAQAYAINVIQTATGIKQSLSFGGFTPPAPAAAAPAAAAPVQRVHRDGQPKLSVVVQLRGGSPTSMPSSEKLEWNSIGSGVIYTIQRYLNGAVDPAFGGPKTTTNLSFPDDTVSLAGEGDHPNVYSYTVSAGSQVTPRTSAAQVVYLLGLNDPTSQPVQELYDFYSYAEVQVYNYYDAPTPASLAKGSLTSPVVIMGESFGGAAAVDLANRIYQSNHSHGVTYLALFDPDYQTGWETPYPGRTLPTALGTHYNKHLKPHTPTYFTVPSTVYEAEDWYGDDEYKTIGNYVGPVSGSQLAAENHPNLYKVANHTNKHAWMTQNVTVAQQVSAKIRKYFKTPSK